MTEWGSVHNVFHFQVNYWRFHSGNEILIRCLFTKWKCTYILDLRPSRWSALNMRFVDKRLQRMQGQCFWSWAGWATIFSWVQKYLDLYFMGAPVHVTLKARRGRFNVPPLPCTTSCQKRISKYHVVML